MNSRAPVEDKIEDPHHLRILTNPHRCIRLQMEIGQPELSPIGVSIAESVVAVVADIPRIVASTLSARLVDIARPSLRLFFRPCSLNIKRRSVGDIVSCAYGVRSNVNLARSQSDFNLHGRSLTPRSLGQRAFNWWSHGEYAPSPAGSVYGQSTRRLAIPPATFPQLYQGHEVTYFTNWVCPTPPTSLSGFTRDDCRFRETTYIEYISQGGATRDPHNLEHWGRGNISHWEVYYDPANLKSCSGSDIRRAGVTREMLERADWKAPLILRLPSEAGAFAIGRNRTYRLHAGLPYLHWEPTAIDDAQSGLWFVVTRNLGRLQERDSGELIHAMNEYYSTNPSYHFR